MKNTTLVLMKDWKPLINALPESDRCYFFDLLFEYEHGVEQVCDRPMVYPVWTFVRSQLDKMKEKYNETCEVKRNNGLKGGRPRNLDKPKETEKNLMVILETKKSSNDNDNNKDNGNDKENDNNKSLVGNLPTEKVSKPKQEKISAKYFVECRDLYFKFVNAKFNIDPLFKAKDGIALSELLNILEKRARDKDPNIDYTLEFCINKFTFFLNTAYKIEFIKDKFTIPILLSQFNQILFHAQKNN